MSYNAITSNFMAFETLNLQLYLQFSSGDLIFKYVMGVLLVYQYLHFLLTQIGAN